MNWKSWKFWAVIAAVVLAIVATVLYFTVPAFKDVLITFFVGVAGFTIGILIGKCFGLDKNGR